MRNPFKQNDASKKHASKENILSDVQNARIAIYAMNAETDKRLSDIGTDTEQYLKRSDEYHQKDLNRIEKDAQKMKLSLEEGDVAAFQENLDAMFAILDEDKDAMIRQDIADSKLKSANVE
jgi:galactokinase/mevalonate kinase-like predicted kinase